MVGGQEQGPSFWEPFRAAALNSSDKSKSAGNLEQPSKEEFGPWLV